MSYLYKKFINERVVGLINDIERIRLCTVIAHIDHGKTTLTDSLIAESGLLSKEIAASARLMDYDRIEQERGITIKASGISLIHEMKGAQYLIHLIDTPGHIDFSSHVTRGLRLTDGALVVVDIVEGIMVQTETVTRQAMHELVTPVLFVNKVDRLIKERRFGVKKTARELDRTVREFNAMLGKYLDDTRLEQWEVSFRKGSVCMGSALDKWGVGLETLLEVSGGDTSPHGLASAFLTILEDIVQSYHKDRVHELQDKYPLAKIVLNAMVKSTPDPTRAQQYRLPNFWTLGDRAPPELLTCSQDGPVVLCVGDVQPDRHAGTVASVRVFSGVLHRGRELKNTRTGEIGKSLQIGLFMSRTRVALQEVPAGNLAFITGLKDIMVGDTLVDVNAPDLGQMKGLQYPTEPVVTYTINPKRLSDLGKIEDIIEAYARTDPALEFEINEETGELLLSGAGELHIEISIEKLQRLGVEVTLGKPMVVLKEQLRKDGESCAGGTDTTSQFEVRAVLTPDTPTDLGGTVLISHTASSCYLIDTSGAISTTSPDFEWVGEAFNTVTRFGPLKGERMRRLTIIIERAQLTTEVPETSWRDITQPLLSAMRASILTGDPVLLEPWVRLEISTPEEYVGTLTAILARRKGDVLEVTSERSLYYIEAEIPVRESFGLANEIRTETSGWASWGAKSGGYRVVGTGEIIE